MAWHRNGGGRRGAGQRHPQGCFSLEYRLYMKRYIERMHLKHYRAGARKVRVHWNRLTGSIPAQLGDLSRAVGSWAAGGSLPFRINVRSSVPA